MSCLNVHVPIANFEQLGPNLHGLVPTKGGGLTGPRPVGLITGEGFGYGGLICPGLVG